MCLAVPPFPNTPSWRGAQLKEKSIGTTLPLYLPYEFLCLNYENTSSV
jgi:hypothetical protein